MQSPISRLMLFLLLIAELFLPRLGNTAPQPEKHPSQDTHQTNTNGAIAPERQQSASDNDFSNLNLSTPQRAVISFVEFYNRITPPTKTTALEEMCAKSATVSYKKDCNALLANRLNYLKGIAKTLEGAEFSYQPLTQLSESPMQLRAGWEEKLSFFDDTTKINSKSMTVTLHKSDNEWKILFVVE